MNTNTKYPKEIVQYNGLRLIQVNSNVFEVEALSSTKDSLGVSVSHWKSYLRVSTSDGKFHIYNPSSSPYDMRVSNIMFWLCLLVSEGHLS